ncbi:MAG: hypothetical protein ABS882_09935 [Lysinibacillus sp.]
MFFLLSIILALVNRDAIPLLLLIYVSGAFYVDSFIKSIVTKQKMLMTLPAPIKQLMQAIYIHTFRYIGVLAIAILPFYSLYASFEKVPSTFSEHLILYCIIVCVTALTCAIYISIYFTLTHRASLTLLQIAAIILNLIISFNIVFVFETLAVPVVAQLLFFIAVYGGACFILFHLCVKRFKNFNLLS